MQYILGAGARVPGSSGLRKVSEGFGAQDEQPGGSQERGLSKAAPWGNGEDQADGLNS